MRERETSGLTRLGSGARVARPLERVVRHVANYATLAAWLLVPTGAVFD